MSASEPLSGGSLSSSFDGAMLNALLLARGVAFERVTELSAECEALKKEAERLHSDRLTLQNWLEQERTFRQRDWNWFGVERARFERRERDMLAEREEIKKQRDNQATQVAHALQTIQRAVGLDDVVPRLRSELGQISRQSDFLATQLSQAIEIIQQKDERITQGLHAASEIAQERDSLAAQLSQAMETIRQITEKRDLLATQDSRAIQIITQRNEEITVRLSAEANLAHEKDSLPKELSQVIQQSDEQKRVEREIAPEKESSGEHHYLSSH
ncbi:hypothetical protein C8R43DRAFT_1049030 [Mycena crocata]|nr:hypothetical protein C8R43DRAFT_1049030 [Mycena crocata]